MAIWETRPETNAGPILRARREEKVNSLIGSPEPAPRPPRPPPGAGGSSCANAAHERHKRSGNSLMGGSITRGTASEGEETANAPAMWKAVSLVRTRGRERV